MTLSKQGTSFIEQSRRQQLIEATIACLADEGYAGASLAKVAQRAAISKSVVIYYFAGKDELMKATVQVIFEELRRSIQPRVEAASTARAQLRAYIESELRFLEQHRTRLLALSAILMNHREADGRLRLREEAEKVNLRTWMQILERGQASGEFRAFAVKPMAATLMHAINGALSQWVADPKLSLSAYAAELVMIFELATRAVGRASTPRKRS